MAIMEIHCPLCKGTLWIEQSSGKVVDHKSADQKKIDLDTFLKAQKTRSSQWDEKMQKARDETARRKAVLEEEFRKARENPEELKGEVESPFKWD